MSWISDILVYIVVLNLFVEFHDAIVIDSFWISILTAILLKALLVAVGGLVHWVGEFFERWEGALATVAGFVVRFAILFSSKLVILQVVSLVFGDKVHLGGFTDLVVLIISMMATRAIIDKIYQRLGEK